MISSWFFEIPIKIANSYIKQKNELLKENNVSYYGGYGVLQFVTMKLICIRHLKALVTPSLLL